MFRINQLFSILLILMPFSLITGPAIPDITITLAILFLIFSLIYNKNFNKVLEFQWFKVSIYFWIYLLVSSLFSYKFYTAFSESLIFLRFLCIPLLIYFFLANSKKKSNLLFISIFLSLLFVILDSLFQFFNYSSIKGFQRDIFGYIPDFAPYNRLTGPFKDQVPGAYISKFAFIGLVFFHIFIQNIKLRLFLIIFYLTICGYLTFISGERMAFATFGLGGLIYVLFNKKFNKLYLSTFIILMFILIGATLKLHPSYNDYTIKKSSSIELGLVVEKNFQCNDDPTKVCSKKVNFQPSFISVISNFRESAYGEIYNLALEMYNNNKLFGIGLNNFKILCETESYYKDKLKNIGCVTHPHNYYLQWIVETGPLGLIIFITYLFFIIKHIVRNNTNYELKLISIIVFVILFWPIMSTGSLTKNWLGVSTFYILGIIIHIHKLKIYR